MIKRIRREIQVPRFYGIAWDDYMHCEVVCAPIFINVVIRFFRAIYIFIKLGGRHPYNLSWKDDAYMQGYKAGYEKGRMNQHEKFYRV